MRHFTKAIPTIVASIQAGAAFANEDILFDWHKVDGFKGSEINGITAIVRGTNGADQTMVDFELLFATSGIKEVTRGISVDIAPASINIINTVLTTKNTKTIGLTFLDNHESEAMSDFHLSVIVFSISIS